MRNSKCWRASMDMALYKFTLPLEVLVEQDMADSSRGGMTMTHGVDETKEVDETEVVHDNVIVQQEVEEDAQHVLHEQPLHEVYDDGEENGSPMDADQCELDEMIDDQMELDDEEYRTFVEG